MQIIRPNKAFLVASPQPSTKQESYSTEQNVIISLSGLKSNVQVFRFL